VTQFCIEEAASEYVEHHELLRKMRMPEGEQGGPAVDPEFSEALAKAKAFARGAEA
jgi:hypothetical protein